MLAYIFFIIISTLLIFLYIKKSLLRGNHYLYANTFKKIHAFYIAIICLRLLLDGLEGSISSAIPFIIIYILSSTILTRTIRHIDSNMEMGKIRKNNIKHLIFISLIFIIVTFEELRSFIWTAISNIFEKLILALFYPLYLLARLLAPEPSEVEPEMSEVIDNFFRIDGLQEGQAIEGYEELARKLLKFASIVKTILIIILTAALIYIVYKIIIKLGNRNYVGEGFTEEREYIKKEKKKDKVFNIEKYPKEFGEQIRYYYRHYLEKLRRSDIEILETDTSLEVNEKAKEVFDEEIEGIREIYINTRYGGKYVDASTVEEMKNLYRNL